MYQGYCENCKKKTNWLTRLSPEGEDAYCEICKEETFEGINFTERW